MGDFEVVCAAGSLRPEHAPGVIHLDHRWTAGGVDLSITFTGAHLLHASVAACVLNDLYREAGGLGIQLDGVRVRADGGFSESWSSTGIQYTVEVDSPAGAAALEELVAIVDQVAEVPRALRHSTVVTRRR
ncbi:MAG: OsmC family protein [Propionibacteriaceae bacterium]|nr:OsmC family protein [Propionibacteriaceae bacterium]